MNPPQPHRRSLGNFSLLESTYVKRIFLTLCCFSTLTLIIAFGWGLTIEDVYQRDPAVQRNVSNHMLVGMGALTFSILVHAIVLTYFMGTGRWIEETSHAYQLPGDFFNQNRRLKYRTIPAMVVCILLLVCVGAFGGAADPASSVGFKGWGDLTPGTIHMLIALVTFAINLGMNFWEYIALYRNGEVIDAVLAEVRRIRLERGLAV